MSLPGIPKSTIASVDFPTPLGPTMAVNSPARISSDRSTKTGEPSPGRAPAVTASARD